ncbi:hypothetical protein SteCoe_31658 [Stentor coeruleus]|uniref:2-amino-3-ketobutyrate coenzyme A ligase, mitochondrial n=1 Tax=Stentor coeruleus TaxID=5963 RepID=A0A1R2B0U8_9CILI|nr:hypothetical protein SteCoe_31658 [Stentor coeruleus]
MAYPKFKGIYQTLLKDIHNAGTYKKERIISSKQGMNITTEGKEVLNFCANNYLGYSGSDAASNPAIEATKKYGFGLSSGRIICGTQTIHKQLEEKISKFHSTEDAILYSSCFDANAGVFEALLTKEDAVLTDALNHASIIDGIRLCSAERHIYRHLDMAHLEECLQKAQSKRIRMIVTDGVFSMDGDFAPLPKIVELASRYNALVFVDESHATGFIGQTGRGVPEYFGVQDKIDIINSTLGKAMGGASGGYTTGHKELIDVLRQKSRPYVFSNSLAPMIVGATLGILDDLERTGQTLLGPLKRNIHLFRSRMTEAGFNIIGHKDSPIVPVMIGDAALASMFADKMMTQNIYVIGFSFPVVPKGQARIRVQLSARHTEEQINRAVDAFIAIGKETEIIK